MADKKNKKKLKNSNRKIMAFPMLWIKMRRPAEMEKFSEL